MFYEFIGYDCPNAPIDAETGQRACCMHTVEMTVAKRTPIGKTIPCPADGCAHQVTRVYSTRVGIIIKGQSQVDINHGDTFRCNVGGSDVRFQFVDHPDTDPTLRRDVSAMAAKAGVTQTAGMNRARYDEKLGRMVVDVASNVRDPLGKIQHATSRHVTRVEPKQKVQMPKRKKRKG
jgi:hypothetical protein